MELFSLLVVMALSLPDVLPLLMTIVYRIRCR
ncbi:hypothetical protein Poly21_01500 [Allorhodopirellula heiligendammensis]|uniref:Uncharacterized protein n=1 Tax=Allorhodopirellula heiligendammensis TaxID=2714739 RepID=A0A5C6C1X7_9BACT|nr:hypothetical protein Poly21_01500 [Allorhodopirellula heiligendammensis]